MKAVYFASVFCSFVFVATLCNQSGKKTEFASQQEVQELREQLSNIMNFLNDTIEERVTNLEIQVADLDEDINFIESEQIIQDQRILELQADSDNLEDSVVALSENLQELDAQLTAAEDSIIALDDRLNSAEDAVASLEETMADLENRLSQMEVSVAGKWACVVAVQIQGTQFVGTVAFESILDENSTIPEGTVLIFNTVNLNLGDGYDISTGQFTVPSGEGGLYFFYTKLYTSETEDLYFAIRLNGQDMCWAIVDFAPFGSDDNGAPSCAVITSLSAGDIVDVFYVTGVSETPLEMFNNYFSGFRIAAE